MGPPVQLLQAIYNKERSGLSPIHLADRAKGTVEQQNVQLTSRTWENYLGQEKYA